MNKHYDIESAFSLDSHIVVCNDDTLGRLKTLPDNTFKLVVSSPPYNIGKEYEKQVGLHEYVEWQAEIMRELHRITSNDGSIVWQVGNFARA